MSYRRKADFDQPTAEEMERVHQAMYILLPIFLMQQGIVLLDIDEGVVSQVIRITGWGMLGITFVSILAGWKFRWTSEFEHKLLNDEWAKAARGQAMIWGIVTLAVLGFAMMLATIWIDVPVRVAINILVGVPLAVAALRLAWLNRAVPLDDE